MREKDIEHGAVYYSAKFDQILVGEVCLNDWSAFGCGIFWSYRLFGGDGTRKYLMGLVKIGHLFGDK